MDEVCRGARSVRVHLQLSTCTVIPADLVSLHVGGGRPPLIAAKCRPQGNKFRGALEDLSDATLERWVVTEMPVSQPKTHNELTRVPVPNNSSNGCGRTSSRPTYPGGLHVVSLACASRHSHAAATNLRSLPANSDHRSSRRVRLELMSRDTQVGPLPMNAALFWFCHWGRPGQFGKALLIG